MCLCMWLDACMFIPSCSWYTPVIRLHTIHIFRWLQQVSCRPHCLKREINQSRYTDKTLQQDGYSLLSVLKPKALVASKAPRRVCDFDKPENITESIGSLIWHSATWSYWMVLESGLNAQDSASCKVLSILHLTQNSQIPGEQLERL